MAIIYQMFNTQDLLALSAAQLAALRAHIAFELRLPKPEVVDTIYPIAAVQFLHLTGLLPAHARPGFDPTKGLLGQFFAEADLAPLSHQELGLLTWAIECALERHPEAVQALQERTAPLYQQWTGHAPHGKDSWV